MRLLIFGASGQTGRELVRQALEDGHTVTGFVRASDRHPSHTPSLQVVVGNVADYSSVASAIDGHDAVVSTLGVATPLKHDPAVVSGVQHIVRAMEEHGVRRLIYQSFIGVRESRAAVGFILRRIAPIPLREEIADHEAKEAVIRASSLEWTIVRPPKLTNGPRTESYRSGESITTWKPIPLLSRADVAHFMIEELRQPNFVRKVARLLP